MLYLLHPSWRPRNNLIISRRWSSQYVVFYNSWSYNKITTRTLQTLNPKKNGTNYGNSLEFQLPWSYIMGEKFFSDAKFTFVIYWINLPFPLHNSICCSHSFYHKSCSEVRHKSQHDQNGWTKGPPESQIILGILYAGIFYWCCKNNVLDYTNITKWKFSLTLHHWKLWGLLMRQFPL